MGLSEDCRSGGGGRPKEQKGEDVGRKLDSWDVRQLCDE
jgi:hypothetical protein